MKWHGPTITVWAPKSCYCQWKSTLYFLSCCPGFLFFPSTLGLLFSVYSVLCFFFAAVWWYCLQHWSQHADVLDVSLKRSSIFEVFCLFVCLQIRMIQWLFFFFFKLFITRKPRIFTSFYSAVIVINYRMLSLNFLENKVDPDSLVLNPMVQMLLKGYLSLYSMMCIFVLSLSLHTLYKHKIMIVAMETGELDESIRV